MLVYELERLAGPVSRETLVGLERYESLFRRWSKTTNLTAPSTLNDFQRRHILDSAQLIPLAGHARKWLDLGSGGGLPGIIIAILLKARTDVSIALIESNHKKAAFLQTVVSELSLPATVHASRIEDARLGLPTTEIVTARALASLDRLLLLSEPWLASRAKALFHKGRDYHREVVESAQHWHFDLIEHQSVVASDSVILEISNLRRRS